MHQYNITRTQPSDLHCTEVSKDPDVTSIAGLYQQLVHTYVQLLPVSDDSLHRGMGAGTLGVRGGGVPLYTRSLCSDVLNVDMSDVP